MLIPASVVLFLATFSDGLLTPSRPTCVGDIVEYNCSIEDTALQWDYNGSLINFFSSQGRSFGNPHIVLGIAFNTSFTPNNGVIISTVRFEANEISNNLQIICSGLNPSNTFSDNITILNFSINSTVNFNAEFVNMTNIRATWTSNENINMYTVNCTLGECMPPFVPQNESQVILPVQNYTSLNVCLTIENMCNNKVITCVEVFLDSTTSVPISKPTSTSVLTMTSLPSSSSLFKNVTPVGSSTTKSGPSITSNQGLIGGAVGGALGGVVLFTIVIIMIILLWKKYLIIVRSSNSVKTIATKDFDMTTYSTTSHSMTTSRGGGLPDVYNRLQHDSSDEKNIDKCNRNWNQTMYAELQTKEAGKQVHVLDVAVVYSDIKGTIDKVYDVDATLDLNSLVLQLSSVEHMWEPYGEAIGVPHDILTQIKTMEVGKRDKFVEVLDYWLYMHPKNNTPTWKEVCKGLQLIGCNELVTEIMKVYTTGKLPIQVDESLSSKSKRLPGLPPPLPPKADVSVLPHSRVQKSMSGDLLSRGKDNELLLDHDKNGTSNASDTRPPPRPPKLKL